VAQFFRFQVTAQFLAEEGAKSICLLSRGGKAPAEARHAMCHATATVTASRESWHLRQVQGRWEWLQAGSEGICFGRKLGHQNHQNNDGSL